MSAPPRINVQYASSGRSKCQEFRCKRTIEKGELRCSIIQAGSGAVFGDSGSGGPAIGVGETVLHGFYCLKPPKGGIPASVPTHPFGGAPRGAYSLTAARLCSLDSRPRAGSLPLAALQLQVLPAAGCCQSLRSTACSTGAVRLVVVPQRLAQQCGARTLC